MKRVLLGLFLVLATAAYSDELISNVSKISNARDDGSCNTVTATETVLAANESRRFAVILAHADNTDKVYIKLGTTATTSDFPLVAGSSVNITSISMYTGRIDAIAGSGTQSVCIIEY